MYINKLDDIANEYNNRAIRIKPVDVKDNTYIDLMESHSVELYSNKDHKSKGGIM